MSLIIIIKMRRRQYRTLCYVVFFNSWCTNRNQNQMFKKIRPTKNVSITINGALVIRKNIKTTIWTTTVWRTVWTFILPVQCTWGRALATSRSCSVTSCITSFFLCTSPFGSGTYSSASRSNSVAYVSDRPWRYRHKRTISVTSL